MSAELYRVFKQSFDADAFQDLTRPHKVGFSKRVEVSCMEGDGVMAYYIILSRWWDFNKADATQSNTGARTNGSLSGQGDGKPCQEQVKIFSGQSGPQSDFCIGDLHVCAVKVKAPLEAPKSTHVVSDDQVHGCVPFNGHGKEITGDPKIEAMQLGVHGGGLEGDQNLVTTKVSNHSQEQKFYKRTLQMFYLRNLTLGKFRIGTFQDSCSLRICCLCRRQTCCVCRRETC